MVYYWSMMNRNWVSYNWGRCVVWSWVSNYGSWVGYYYWSMVYYWSMMNRNWVSYNWGMNNGRSMVWLVYSRVYSWSMTKLDGSMVTYVGGSNSQEGRECDKSLHVDLI